MYFAIVVHADFFFFFFFNDTATTEIYTLSLHDALPISPLRAERGLVCVIAACPICGPWRRLPQHRERHGPKIDRKSTRLNSSHTVISYAVFCLKKKNDSKWRAPVSRVQPAK